MSAQASTGRAKRVRSLSVFWLRATALVLAVGFFKSINLLLLLGYLMLTVWCLNGLLARRQLRGLQARRRVGGLVFAGVPHTVEVAITNPGRSTRHGVRIEDGGPDHTTSWFLSRLAGREMRTLRTEVTLPARGRYAWGPVRAGSGYPFGLARRAVELVAGEEIIVLPRLGWLHRGRFLLHLRGAPNRERVRRRPQPYPGPEGDFHALRPYRSGDNPRSIHWRTSARRGTLMVREFEDAPGDDLVLVFDATAPDGPGPLFEQAVSLAATVCSQWCRQPDNRLVAAVGGQLLDGRTGPAHARRVLEALAVVEPAPPGGNALADPLRGIILPSAPVVLISAGASRLAAALRQARPHAVTCLDAAYLVGMDFYNPPAPAPACDPWPALV